MEQKDFNALSSVDEKLNVLFKEFTNHLSEHKNSDLSITVIKGLFEGITNILSEHKVILDDLFKRMPNRPL